MSCYYSNINTEVPCEQSKPNFFDLMQGAKLKLYGFNATLPVDAASKPKYLG
jgi:hypothetical protein